jgi:hypothetical protein
LILLRRAVFASAGIGSVPAGEITGRVVGLTDGISIPPIAA